MKKRKEERELTENLEERVYLTSSSTVQVNCYCFVYQFEKIIIVVA